MRRKIIKLENSLRKSCLFRCNGKKVGIVSCDRFKGRILDDLLLQRYFLKHGVRAEIISWQDDGINYGDFDGLIIGSMWGYQNFLENFSKWLVKIEKTDLTVINPLSVIQENYDKARQFRALKKAGLPTIDTLVINKGELDKFKFSGKNVVLKPAISGSGENTFLICDQDDLEKAYKKLIKVNKERELLVQPFVPEIIDGEIGIIMIAGKIVNTVRRFPGILKGEYKVELVSLQNLPHEASDLANKVFELPVYQQATYLRIDMVLTPDGYKIMEVEAFEPQLYYYLLEDGPREKMLGMMFDETMKKMKKKPISEV